MLLRGPGAKRMTSTPALPDAVRLVADELDVDVFVYVGNLQRGSDDELIELCRRRARRKNVLLVLTTRGGDPNAAYRIARCLQDSYSPRRASAVPAPEGSDTEPGRFLLAVLSVCKSAGTLIAVGADKIYMTEHAEFGPLDVQLRKPDEVGERTSGLTPVQALSFLENQSVSLFKKHFSTLRFDEDLVFSTKMAAEMASKLTVELLEPIYAQIDPMRLAELDRSMKITLDYGERLRGTNLKDNALRRLITGYPSHGFVIDRREAAELFNDVNEPPASVKLLTERLKDASERFVDAKIPLVMCLNDLFQVQQSPEAEHENDAEDRTGEGVRRSGGTEPEVRARSRARGSASSDNGAPSR